MKKRIKIICVLAILIIAVLSGTVGAFNTSGICKGLMIAVGIQEKVLYGSEGNILINDAQIGYNEETEKYDISLEVLTTNINDGATLTVKPEAYAEDGTSVTSQISFTVTGNTVASNVANIVISADGDASIVKKIKVTVSYTNADSTTDSDYVELKTSISPQITLGDPVVEAENMPENVIQKITIPVVTEDIDEGSVLNVKLVKDGMDIDTSKYSVEGNTVIANLANIVISAGPEMTIGQYMVEISYTYPVRRNNRISFNTKELRNCIHSNE